MKIIKQLGFRGKLFLRMMITMLAGLFLLYIGVNIRVQALLKNTGKAQQLVSFQIFLFFLCFVVLIIYLLIFSLIIRRAFSQTSHVLNAIKGFSNDNSESGSESEDISLEAFMSNITQTQDRINRFVDNIKELVSVIALTTGEVKLSASDIKHVSDRITQSISQLAQGATEQALSTQSGNETIMNIAEMIDCIAEDMSASEKLAASAIDSMNMVKDAISFQEDKMNENREISKQMRETVDNLLHKSEQVGEILSVINDVAAQTNLLSLNAAIEAARAGEQGKGFAVVASEIGKLAEQSGQSSKQIKVIVDSVQAEIENTVKHIMKSDHLSAEQERALSETIVSINDISSKVESITFKVRGVFSATEMLSEDAKQAVNMLNSIAAISEETAAGTEEASASVEEENNIIQLIEECANELYESTQKLQEKVLSFSNQSEDALLSKQRVNEQSYCYNT